MAITAVLEQTTTIYQVTFNEQASVVSKLHAVVALTEQFAMCSQQAAVILYAAVIK